MHGCVSGQIIDVGGGGETISAYWQWQPTVVPIQLAVREEGRGGIGRSEEGVQVGGASSRVVGWTASSGCRRRQGEEPAGKGPSTSS